MKRIALLFLITMHFSSCFLLYTFKDISIEPDVKTFYVENFENNADNSPPTLNQDFSEALREKIVNETSLDYNEIEPHIIFSGEIKSFTVTPQAPTQDGAALNRLEIKIEVEYVNILHEDENWKNTFSFYSDFDIDKSLADVEETLINEIFDNILEDVINKSFNNW